MKITHAACIVCGKKKASVLDAKGDSYCYEHALQKYACVHCKNYTLVGMEADREWFCIPCYIKYKLKVKQRKPRTKKDFELIKQLNKPVWLKDKIDDN